MFDLSTLGPSWNISLQIVLHGKGQKIIYISAVQEIWIKERGVIEERSLIPVKFTWTFVNDLNYFENIVVLLRYSLNVKHTYCFNIGKSIKNPD